MHKHEYFQTILKLLPPNTIAIETGRIREQGRIHEGYSSKWLAECSNVSRLYSIDCNPMTEGIVRAVVDSKAQKKICFINTDSVGALYTLSAILPQKSVGFILLDSANNPLLAMQEFLAIHGTLTDDCLIVLDDVYNELGFKGEILLPKFEKLGYRITPYGDYALIIRSERS